MADSKAIHLLWQLLPASYETTDSMNGLECFSTHARTDQLTLCCLNSLEETVQIYTFSLKKGTFFLTENTCIFARTFDLFM